MRIGKSLLFLPCLGWIGAVSAARRELIFLGDDDVDVAMIRIVGNPSSNTSKINIPPTSVKN